MNDESLRDAADRARAVLERARRHASKLSDAQVIAIYGRYHYEGATLRTLSQEFDVDISTIRRIVRYESHKLVKRPSEDAWNELNAPKAREHAEGCRCPECDPDYNDPRAP